MGNWGGRKEREGPRIKRDGELVWGWFREAVGKPLRRSLGLLNRPLIKTKQGGVRARTGHKRSLDQLRTPWDSTREHGLRDVFGCIVLEGA